MAFEVGYSIDSQNRTIIEVFSSALLLEQRIRIYAPNGDEEIFDVKWFNDKKVSFAIEDKATKYIDPYPNGTSGKVKIARESRMKLSETIVGRWEETESEELTYPINSNAWTRPSVSMNLTPTELSNGYNLKGQSKVQATISGNGKCGASIKSCKLKVGSSEYPVSNGGTVASDAFSAGGIITVSGIVTDSRGFTNSISEYITVINNFPQFDYLLSSNSSSYVNQNLSYAITPPIDSFSSAIKLEVVAGDDVTEIRTEKIGKQPGRYVSEMPVAETLDQLEGIYEKYPDTINVKLRATLLTYEDDNYTKLMNVTSPVIDVDLYIPEDDSTRPTISEIVCIPTPIVLNNDSLFVQGKTGIKASINASGKYGSNIVSTKWRVDGQDYNNNDESPVLNATGAITITAIVEDGRGFRQTQQKKITFEPYVTPAVVPVNGQSAVYLERETGDIVDKLYVSAAKRFSTVAGYNKCELRIRKKVGVNAPFPESYTTLLGVTEGNEYNQVTKVNIKKENIYYIELSVKDSLNGESSLLLSVPTEEVFMDRNGEDNSIAFGGYAIEKNSFEVYKTVFFRGGIFIDDLEGNARYKITIGEGGQLFAEPVNTTFSLRR